MSALGDVYVRTLMRAAVLVAGLEDDVARYRRRLEGLSPMQWIERSVCETGLRNSRFDLARAQRQRDALCLQFQLEELRRAQ